MTEQTAGTLPTYTLRKKEKTYTDPPIWMGYFERRTEGPTGGAGGMMILKSIDMKGIACEVAH
jgi:hypothetical protein